MSEAHAYVAANKIYSHSSSVNSECGMLFSADSGGRGVRVFSLGKFPL